MLAGFEYMTSLTSLMFMEGLNWAGRLVPVAFMSLILIFGLALIVSGILQIILPVDQPIW